MSVGPAERPSASRRLAVLRWPLWFVAGVVASSGVDTGVHYPR
jgi:hypothetical protein